MITETTSSNPIVIYHKSCADGQGAAAAVLTKYPYAELFGGVYSEPPPNVAGREVIIVDFSYKLETMKELCDKAASVLIIDHHKTAIEALSDFEHPKLTKRFDMNHSGAVLAWLTMWPEAEVPEILLHIEDRDLWRFDLVATKEINAYLYSLEFQPMEWVKLLDAEIWKPLRQDIINHGHTLMNQDAKRSTSLARNAVIRSIAGHAVPVCNAPYFHASDVAHQLASGEAFAATYHIVNDRVTFSLRSQSSVDVAEIAESFGGGGHKKASGFNILLKDALELGMI